MTLRRVSARPVAQTKLAAGCSVKYDGDAARMTDSATIDRTLIGLENLISQATQSGIGLKEKESAFEPTLTALQLPSVLLTSCSYFFCDCHKPGLRLIAALLKTALTLMVGKV